MVEEAQALSKELLGLNDNYEILFLGGGASLQFAMAPLNLLNTNGKAGYINTGAWSKKAIKEGQNVGNIEVIASSEDKNFNYIPKGFDIVSDLDFLHFTSNNTIFGTQMKEFPKTDVTLVSDMSSDIFSRVIDGNKFGIIYAGAQKNMGPAGSTMVAINKDILGKTDRKILNMLNYESHIKAGSMYNTPPVFSIYVSLLTLRWLKQNGGVASMEKANIAKANVLYNEIDRNALFKGTAEVADRSTMNATFVLDNTDKGEEFDKLAAAANLSGLKGHRSVGGYRASIYNAMPIEGVNALVDTMKEFESKFG
jgi:phosphoserine aminotransferase